MNTKIFTFLYENKIILLLILCAYLFGILCRLDWVFWADNFESFKWNGILMISTNDGYAFAEGARDMLAGFHQENDLSYYGTPLSAITAFIVKFTNIPLEVIMLYLSMFLGSLIVIPLILIGKDLGIPSVGGAAAFIAVIANSYYNRTMVGYYDTDMLNIVLPCFILWGLIRLTLGLKEYFIAALSMSIYFWWYPSSFSLNLAILAWFILFVLLFRRNDKFCYLSIILMFFSLCDFPLLLKLIFIILVAGILHFKSDILNKKNLIIFASLIVICFIFKSNLSSIFIQMKFYVFRDSLESSEFHFFNVNQTIRESSIVPLSEFYKRISGSMIVFWLSLVGYIFACFRFKTLLLTIPMVALGFVALKGGLRFTIYAVPFMAFGFGYLLYFIVEILLKFLKEENKKIILILPFILLLLSFFALVDIYNINSEFIKKLVFISIPILLVYFYFFRKNILAMFLFCACSWAIIPMLLHIRAYEASSVFTQGEVAVLDKLKNIAQREDYAISWWDYGYPIRFYSDVKTLIDGGKHLGSDNFAVSKALFSNELASVNMARSEVEYTERKFNENFSSNLAQMLKDYNQSDINKFLFSLNDESFIPPKASRDIYFVLPYRMHMILNVIAKFSYIDLKDGRALKEPVFFYSSIINRDENFIYLDNNIKINTKGTKLFFGEKSYDINSLIITQYIGDKLNVEQEIINSDAEFFVILVNDFERIFIMDKQMFSSAYTKLFVLEDYDKNLFEPVILTPIMKVYKIKK